VSDPETAFINQSIPDGLQLAQWLQYLGATSTQGQVQLADLRHDMDGVVAPSQLWLIVNDLSSSDGSALA
jgi:hypothetical protein